MSFGVHRAVYGAHRVALWGGRAGAQWVVGRGAVLGPRSGTGRTGRSPRSRATKPGRAQEAAPSKPSVGTSSVVAGNDYGVESAELADQLGLPHLGVGIIERESQTYDEEMLGELRSKAFGL